tara:strand:- start:337 stop:588 length:252 start_codon:yes stop_codon:yes gene_type:complete
MEGYLLHEKLDREEQKEMDYKNKIKYTLQLVICILLGLEIAIPPNPYTNELVVALTLYICLKHDVPQKILDNLTHWLFDWKNK